MAVSKTIRVREWDVSRSTTLVVDRENCVIRNVKVLGWTARNKGRRYPRPVAEAALSQYEGRAVNLNHSKPTDPHRDYHDRFGWLESVHAKDDGLYADLRYNPKHEHAEKTLYFAEHNPSMFGLSHDVYLREEIDPTDGCPVVKEIVKVNSVDIVADPSTTNGLHEAEELMDPTLTPPSTSGGADSVESFRQHLVQMLQEKIGEITDLAKLRKLSEKLEKFLSKGGAADEEAEPKDEQEAMALARRSASPVIKALLAKLDATEVREATTNQRLQQFTQDRDLADKRKAVRDKAKAAGLPDFAVTDLFVDQLASHAQESQDKLIADRKALLNQGGGGQIVVSPARESVERIGGGGGEAPSVDALVAAVRGNR